MNPAAEPLAAGQARAVVEIVDGSSSLVHQQARAPSKLLVPRPRGPAVWLCHLSFGGGVVAGDHLRTHIRLGDGSTVLSGTQGATKIYRDPEQRWSRQELVAEVGDGALLIQLPHPITAYSGARFQQRQDFRLSNGGSILWWEVVSAGRPDLGEHWDASALELHSQLSIDGTVILRDNQRLHGPAPRQQLRAWRCTFTLGMVGPRCQAAAAALCAGNAGLAPSSPDCRYSCNPLADGCLIRGLAVGVEEARTLCQHAAQWICPIIGDDPWKGVL